MHGCFVFRLTNHIVVFVSSDKDVDLIPDTQDRRWKQLWSVYTGTVNVLQVELAPLAVNNPLFISILPL